MADWHLYLVRTGEGHLYAGIATDVARRLDEHRSSGPGAKGAKYLRGRGPLELVYTRRIGSRSLALRAEGRLKRCDREMKDRIVATNPSARMLLRRLGVGPRAPS